MHIDNDACLAYSIVYVQCIIMHRRGDDTMVKDSCLNHPPSPPSTLTIPTLPLNHSSPKTSPSLSFSPSPPFRIPFPPRLPPSLSFYRSPTLLVGVFVDCYSDTVMIYFLITVVCVCVCVPKQQQHVTGSRRMIIVIKNPTLLSTIADFVCLIAPVIVFVFLTSS